MTVRTFPTANANVMQMWAKKLDLGASHPPPNPQKNNPKKQKSGDEQERAGVVAEDSSSRRRDDNDPRRSSFPTGDAALRELLGGGRRFSTTRISSSSTTWAASSNKKQQRTPGVSAVVVHQAMFLLNGDMTRTHQIALNMDVMAEVFRGVCAEAGGALGRDFKLADVWGAYGGVPANIKVRTVLVGRTERGQETIVEVPSRGSRFFVVEGQCVGAESESYGKSERSSSSVDGGVEVVTAREEVELVTTREVELFQ